MERAVLSSALIAFLIIVALVGGRQQTQQAIAQERYEPHASPAP